MHGNFTLHTSLQGEPPQQWLNYTCPRQTEWQKEGMKYSPENQFDPSGVLIFPLCGQTPVILLLMTTSSI